MPGVTAYVGIADIGEVREGDTVFVSGAAGAVGSVAAQLASTRGARVIGSAGTPEKVAWLRELGLDGVFDYHETPTREALRELAPDGIDVYFDNVGGETLEAAIGAMRLRGRIVACGAISRYNATEALPGPRNLFMVVTKRLRMQGFIVSDHYDRFPAFLAEVGPLVELGVDPVSRDRSSRGSSRRRTRSSGCSRGPTSGRCSSASGPSREATPLPGLRAPDPGGEAVLPHAAAGPLLALRQARPCQALTPSSAVRSVATYFARAAGPSSATCTAPEPTIDAVRERRRRGGLLRRRDAEPRVERHAVSERPSPRHEPRERRRQLGPGAGRAGQRDEVEPAVGRRRGERDPLVGRCRRDEVDAPELGPLAGRDVGDDQAGRAAQPRRLSRTAPSRTPRGGLRTSSARWAWHRRGHGSRRGSPGTAPSASPARAPARMHAG